MTAIAAAVPCTGLEWRQWARNQIEALRLPSPEAHLLTVLTDRASAAGTIRLGVPLLARQLGGISESQVHRRMQALARRGLLRTRQQGRGRIALRELVAVPEPAQLSLFDAAGVPTAAPAVPAPVARAARPPMAPWPAPSGESCPRIDASLPSHQCEAAVVGQFEEEDARAARAPHLDIDDPKGVLAPRLSEVLEIIDRRNSGAGRGHRPDRRADGVSVGARGVPRGPRPRSRPGSAHRRELRLRG